MRLTLCLSNPTVQHISYISKYGHGISPVRRSMSAAVSKRHICPRGGRQSRRPPSDILLCCAARALWHQKHTHIHIDRYHIHTVTNGIVTGAVAIERGFGGCLGLPGGMRGLCSSADIYRCARNVPELLKIFEHVRVCVCDVCCAFDTFIMATGEQFATLTRCRIIIAPPMPLPIPMRYEFPTPSPPPPNCTLVRRCA